MLIILGGYMYDIGAKLEALRSISGYIATGLRANSILSSSSSNKLTLVKIN
jgi:hypothetical protein